MKFKNYGISCLSSPAEMITGAQPYTAFKIIVDEMTGYFLSF